METIMFRPDVRTSRLCRTLCEETGLYGMWSDDGPTALAVRLLRENGGPLSADQKIMFLCAWAFWNGAGRITMWAAVHRLKAQHLFTLGEVLQALAGGSYSTEAWLSKRNCSTAPHADRRSRK